MSKKNKTNTNIPKIEKTKSKTNNEPKQKKSDNFQSTSFFDFRSTKGQILFVLITIISTSVIHFIPTENITNSFGILSNKPNDTKNNVMVYKTKKPTYHTYGEVENSTHLHLVHAVLQKLGLRIGTNITNLEWDFLWGYEFPFRQTQFDLKNLKPHQRVNHFPGIGALITKVYLATTNTTYIPKAFELPDHRQQFLDYAKKNPRKLFLQKNNHHREIYVRQIDEMDLDDGETFIQEYIDNPLLVDGHRFDFGVYVIITSVDPLRIYMYKGDAIFRYCPEPYYPFDPTNLDKYIVGDDYLPTWYMPSLAYYFTELGFGNKASFDAYLAHTGNDPEFIWDQVEEIIRLIVLEKEQNIIKNLKTYKSKRNFYEMMRFDFIIDDHLIVWLLEANMSPILQSPEFLQNRILFQQVAYHLFNLVGIGATYERESFGHIDDVVESMVSSDKNIVINPIACSTEPCTKSCIPIECKFCIPCLNAEWKTDIQEAYREHVHRGDTKRLFPEAVINKKMDEDFFKTLNPKNQLMTRWFYDKCLMDSSWCS